MEHRILGLHSLVAEVERYEPGLVGAGRRSEILVKTDDLRVILVTMEKGALIKKHSAPGTITIQSLIGQFAVQIDDDDVVLESGSLLTLAGGVEHAVRAHSSGAFLLTIAWSGKASDPDHIQ